MCVDRRREFRVGVAEEVLGPGQADARAGQLRPECVPGRVDHHMLADAVYPGDAREFEDLTEAPPGARRIVGDREADVPRGCVEETMRPRWCAPPPRPGDN